MMKNYLIRVFKETSDSEYTNIREEKVFTDESKIQKLVKKSKLFYSADRVELWELVK